MPKPKFKYVILTQYAGEQGHLPGNEFREGRVFDSPEEACDFVDAATARHEFDYQNVWIVVTRR